MCTNQNVSSMKTTLLVVGRTVEQHFITAINDYVQRTKRYLSFEMEVIPELKNTKSLSMEVQKEKEGELICKAFQPGDVIVLLDEGGKEMRSIEFADYMKRKMNTVDKYLFDRLTNASRNRIQKSAEAGFVMANNKPVKSSYKVKPMDVITIMMDRPRYENEVIPEDIPLNIIYEDKYLMVVNKPAGLVVHPGHGNYQGTLVNAIAWHMKDNPDYDANDPHVGLVHRIDKDTSGLLVIAKTPDAKTNLGMQFFNKTTKRRYRALVWGTVEQDEGTITGNIGRNPRDRMQMTVLPDDQGKHAVTHYRVLEHLGYVTLVECILETGRAIRN